MFSEPRKQKIEAGDAARKAEQEPRPAPIPRVESGNSARDAERVRETTIGRTVQGFTLSARVGKPFRFEDGEPQTAGEAQPIARQESSGEIEIQRTNYLTDKKLSRDTSPRTEQASDDSANESFQAIPGSFLKALFRRRSRPASRGNDET
jgi:nitric oxide reductase activation protein